MRMPIIILLLFASVNFLFTGQVKTDNDIISVECRGTSFMGSGITVDDAKKFAVNDAKRTALEQVGTYLESSMKIENHMVTSDEIQTYTAGILKTEILSAENKVIDGTFAVVVNIKAEIDKRYLKDRLSRIKDDSRLRKMLEEQKKLNDRLTREISNLKADKEIFSKKSKKIARSLEAADYFDMGFNAQEKGEYLEAVKFYNKAIDLDPEIAQIYNNRGLCYYFLKDLKKAERNFDKAIGIDPGLSMAYNNKAIVNYERGNYKIAINYFNKVLNIDPGLEQTYYNRGFAYFKMDDVDNCLKDLKKYLELTSDSPDRTRIEKFVKKHEDKKKAAEIKYTTVPDLYYTSLYTAKQRIKKAGLELGMIKRVTDIDKGFDRVLGQSLKRGTKVEEGTVIDITLNEESKTGGW